MCLSSNCSSVLAHYSLESGWSEAAGRHIQVNRSNSGFVALVILYGVTHPCQHTEPAVSVDQSHRLRAAAHWRMKRKQPSYRDELPMARGQNAAATAACVEDSAR